MEKSKFPPLPQKNSPLDVRILGGRKTPSQWEKIANTAEKSENWGDAYYYWKACITEHTRKDKNKEEREAKADACLKKWRSSLKKRCK